MRKILYFFPIILITSCSKQKKSPENQITEKKSLTVHLSAEQIKQAGMISEAPVFLKQTKTLHVSGTLDVPPQNLVSISCPLGGFIRKMDLLQGATVRKGETLIIMENPDYIEIQKDYLDTREQYKLALTEAERQKKLVQGNAGTEKILQQAETALNQIIIKKKAAEAKLHLLGIDPENFSPEKISSRIILKSPVKGFVKSIHGNIGKYAAPSDVIMEIVDTEHLHVELSVFEKDIDRVVPGQKILFNLLNEDESRRSARVYLVGKALNNDRTVHVHGHLDKEDPSLLPGLFVNAQIETGLDSSWTIQQSSVVYLQGKPGVFEDMGSGNYRFVPITAGPEKDGRIGIKMDGNQEIKNMKVVFRGANALLGQMTGGEE